MSINFFKGIFLTAIISLIGIACAKLPFVHQIGFSAVTVSIILGMLVGNTVYPKIAKQCYLGVDFSKAKLLRLGIIFYGFHLTFQQVMSIGLSGIITDALIIITTFALTWILGKKLFALDDQTIALMGAGASICGAAAVLATDPVVKGGSDKVAIAVATVVIFGTLGMFLYPEMYHLNLWHLNEQAFGVYIGSTVHEVAQVYAAGEAIGQSAADTAVTVKMIRVMMLAPFLLWLSWFWSNKNQAPNHKAKIVIPWFAVWFIIVVGFNSFHLLSVGVVSILQVIDTFLLTMAMTALGLTTHFNAIKRAGFKPILLAAMVMLWLVVFGGYLQKFLPVIF